MSTAADSQSVPPFSPWHCQRTRATYNRAEAPQPVSRSIAARGFFLMDLIEKWKTQDAIEMYGIRLWGKGYFGINAAGHVTVHPNKREDQAIDLKELTDQLQARGIQL